MTIEQYSSLSIYVASKVASYPKKEEPPAYDVIFEFKRPRFCMHGPTQGQTLRTFDEVAMYILEALSSLRKKHNQPYADYEIVTDRRALAITKGMSITPDESQKIRITLDRLLDEN